jgi:hypothetical protein
VFGIDGRSTASGGVPSFMRAGGPNAKDAKGEWHMHCHVLMHMDDGMMGSLVIAEGGDPAVFQAAPLSCPGDANPDPLTVVVTNNKFTPPATPFVVPVNTVVTFDFQGFPHTVVTTAATNATAIAINNGGGDFDPVPAGTKRTVLITGSPGGVIKFECGIHGSPMSGEIHLS